MQRFGSLIRLPNNLIEFRRSSPFPYLYSVAAVSCGVGLLPLENESPRKVEDLKGERKQ